MTPDKSAEAIVDKILPRIEGINIGGCKAHDGYEMAREKLREAILTRKLVEGGLTVDKERKKI